MKISFDNLRKNIGYDFNTVLLSNEECAELARSFIDAAYDLIYDFKDETAQKLVNILNEDF